MVVKRRFYFLFSIIIFYTSYLNAAFIAGTIITTPSGQIPIEELARGSLVLGYDAFAKKWPILAVRATQTSTTQRLYIIATDRGNITSTFY